MIVVSTINGLFNFSLSILIKEKYKNRKYVEARDWKGNLIKQKIKLCRL